MLIDFHTHVFPEKIAERTLKALSDASVGIKPCFNGTVDGLLELMEGANADISVALPVLTKPTQFQTVAEYAIGINERFAKEGKKIISFGGIHPDCDDIEGKLSFLKDNGIKGVKIHPDYQNTFIDDAKYLKILKTAKKLDLIVVTHSGIDYAYLGQPVKCSPDRVKKVIDEVGYGKFVLGHYGAHAQWEEVFEKLAGLDVYFDTAYTLDEISPELFKQILKKHGDDKILFATDCPWKGIKSHADILRSYKLNKETEDKIFYKNALKLLEI